MREFDDRQVEWIKGRVLKTSGHQKGNDYQDLISEIMAETGLSIEQVAAALADILLFQRREADRRPPSSRGDDRGRRGQRDRGDRGSRERGNRGDRDTHRDRGPLVRFRVEVGRNHGLRPGSLVAAIAGETSIDGKDIGRIKINDDYSTVDLPKNKSEEVLEALRDVTVADQHLNIAQTDEQPDTDRQQDSRDGRSRYDQKKGRQIYTETSGRGGDNRHFRKPKRRIRDSRI